MLVKHNWSGLLSPYNDALSYNSLLQCDRGVTPAGLHDDSCFLVVSKLTISILRYI